MILFRLKNENTRTTLCYITVQFLTALFGCGLYNALVIVAGGTNALAIHYLKNDCAIDVDSMVLVDCGCDLYGYVSDVTRTWPVSGMYVTGACCTVGSSVTMDVF